MIEVLAGLSLVDYGFILLILISGVISLFRGFIKEAVSLLSWVVAVWAVWTFDEATADLIAPWVSDPVVKIWGARFILFVFVLVAGGLFGTGLALMLNKGGLSALDRVFGTVFGLARGVLLVGVAIIVLEMIGFNKSAWWQDSKLIPYAAPVTDQIKGLARGGFDYVDQVVSPAAEPEPVGTPEGSGE